MPGVMAMVLAGGSGEPMSVLTAERAVCAVPFGGKYRVIDFVLSNCRHSDVGRVGVITQHNPASLHDHIGAGRAWELDRRGGGVYVLQPYVTRSRADWYRGSAHALAMNLDVIRRYTPERVLVLSGDQVYRMDYRALLRVHEQRRAALTIAVGRVPPDQTRRFGMVTLDHEGRVSAFVEKPDEADTPFASMGIYVFEYDVLESVLADQPLALATDVVAPLLESGSRVYAHEFAGYWDDVGTIRSYYAANMELVAPEPRLVLHETDWPILTRDEERAPVLLLDDAAVEDSLVANGCQIAGTVRRSVLSPGVRVEPGAVVSDAIVMNDCVIESGARVCRAILDKYVRVGQGAVVGCDTQGDAAKSELGWLGGLTLVGKEANIPAGAHIGRSCVIGLGADADALGGKEVDDGTQVPSRSWLEGLR